MKCTNPLRASLASLWIPVVAGFLMAGGEASAQAVQHLTTPQQGGMPGVPVMTGMERASNGVTITWDGPSGYYQLLQKLNLGDKQWQKVGGPNLTRRATVTNSSSNAFFLVSGPGPQYAGAQTCLECHEGIHNQEMDTKHAGAFTDSAFVAKGGQTNSSCLPCHTVGFGLPTGFVSPSKTPHLAGVQCENCHGPAGNHAANDGDLTVRPRAELASAMCGGCHNVQSDRPHYEEWKTSGHSVLTEDMSAPNRISSCGRCHSGSVRLAMLKNEALPTGDANVPVECAVCHDPHQQTANPAQLRNPLASTNDYFLSTSDVFTNKYDPNVNICAQCHNHRGASWTSSGRPPHHSPQYNMLLGTVGELASGAKPNRPAAHALDIEKQCVSCHMATQTHGGVHPDSASHTFKVDSYESCLQCHPFPELFVMFTSTVVSNQIQQVKLALDEWATTKAPSDLQTKYGVRAWEYTSAGSLSGGGTGPNAAEQGQIPDAIKKARFNLYIVAYDGSLGVHNGPFALDLLATAANWVQQELNK